ncbi:MAG: hypothetical protein ABIO40_11150, partial [Devosia sp.]
LKSDAVLASRIAAILAARLDATSALLVELSREHGGKPHDKGILARIMGALIAPPHAPTEDKSTDLFTIDPALWPRGPL